MTTFWVAKMIISKKFPLIFFPSLLTFLSLVNAFVESKIHILLHNVAHALHCKYNYLFTPVQAELRKQMLHSFCRAATNQHNTKHRCSILMANTTVFFFKADTFLSHKGSKFLPLPTNFCGIVLLRLATLLANLSSTKALSDPVWLMSSLCSLWLLSSFITGKQDREMDLRVKVNLYVFFTIIV